MYERHKPCSSLEPPEICFVVEQYREGIYLRKFHEHIKKSRVSRDAQINLLRALVIHFSGISAETIVRCHLNSRGDRDNSLRIVTSYPEPAVLRFYCGSDTVAWSDQVIVPEKFRAL